MSRSIRITSGDVSLTAELDDSPTADAVFQALPIEAAGNCWGDEIYFSIPIEVELEADARAEVDVGALAFWPPGNAFCIFFGPTPASIGSTPCAASPVNVFGRIVENIDVLRDVASGARVRVEAE